MRTNAMLNKDGQKVTQQADIAEVFADFYRSLYNAASPTYGAEPAAIGKAEPVDVEEVQRALRKIKRGKAFGDYGLMAEMLKSSHTGLLVIIAAVFTDILHGLGGVPDTWMSSRLVVIFKKGDPKLPKSYRPIAIIPILCKLFCTLLLNRIRPILDALQEPEQAGF